MGRKKGKGGWKGRGEGNEKVKRRDKEDEGERKEKKNGKSKKYKKGKNNREGKGGYKYNARKRGKELKVKGKEESKEKVIIWDEERRVEEEETCVPVNLQTFVLFYQL